MGRNELRRGAGGHRADDLKDAVGWVLQPIRVDGGADVPRWLRMLCESVEQGTEQKESPIVRDGIR